MPFITIIVFGHIAIVLNALLCTTDGLFVTQTHASNLWWHVASSTIVFFGLYKCYARGITIYQARLLCGICCFLYIFMPPTLSDDIYRYMWDGEVSMSGASPYQQKPQDHVINPQIYPHLNSQQYYSVYPPFSQLLFQISATMPTVHLRFYLYKILCFICFATTIFLLKQMLPPDKHLCNLLFIGCNPALLVELVGQGHTEIFMVTALIACLYFLESHRGLSMLCLSFAALTKLYPVLLFPFVILRKKYLKYLWIPPLTCVLLCLWFYSEGMFLNIRESLQLYTQKFSFNSLSLVFWEKSFYFLGVDDNYTWALKACWGTFLALYACIFVIYVRWKNVHFHQRTFANIVFLILLLYSLCSPIVHPWYITPLLVMAILCEKTPRVLMTWSILIIPTYLFYLSENLLWRNIYVFFEYPLVVFSVVFWMLENTMRALAHRKYNICKEFIVGNKVLDNGSAEGYLGEYIHEKLHIKVHNLDVLPLNKSYLPYTIYDGKKIPLADSSIDTTICALMLHHCEDPQQVLSEVVRVTRKRIIILESTFENTFDLKLLQFFDRSANFVRSYGKMGKEQLHFKTVAEWEVLFKSYQLNIHKVFWANRFIHKHVVFILDKE
ncbi:methyltransferase domain-containing protein [Candidatus Uabimicrobium amorphum]|uniref:Methyltransferase type 11 domain-containing protein n=1 Tax=Uabimicrobium amorphum TaxID=2596890 RepID=A0A5S9IKN3_UABAM|nr:methyltransferase domain-containing protein [Candidatus Uabimicrobium amorphum]BBM83629.1 hypothetical protein UABAM_01982 [Candidatus Uabimicrobium amorphum]